MTITLGSKIRDTITSFTGTATARHEYLNGCIRWSITPNELKDGKPIEVHVFDEQQLVIVADAAAETEAPQKKVGGPYNEPSRPAVPVR